VRALGGPVTDAANELLGDIPWDVYHEPLVLSIGRGGAEECCRGCSHDRLRRLLLLWDERQRGRAWVAADGDHFPAQASSRKQQS